MMQNDFAGMNGFIWWIGVVEDRQDPLKLGRCRVRCVGWHSDNKQELPTSSLPWAQQMTPINNSNPYAPKEGDMVMGFFIDGQNAQEPVMMGVLPGIPLSASNPQQAFNDPRVGAQLSRVPIKPGEKATTYPRVLDEPTTSRVARNESISQTQIQNINKNRLTNELQSSYNARYPYNNVYESESGHLLEYDDTPGAERIHTYHRSGSYQEYRPDGTVQFKTKENSYESIGKNKNMYVKGDMTVVIDGNLSFVVGKSVSISAGTSFGASAKTTASMSGLLSASVSSLVNASLSGQVFTSAGGIFSKTSVKGLTTDVTASTVTTVSGTAATVVNSPGVLLCSGTGSAFFQSAGLTQISGSVVNILGGPVGGATGAAAAVQQAAEQASEAAIENAKEADPSISSSAQSAANQNVPVSAEGVAARSNEVGQGISNAADSAQTPMQQAVSGLPEPGTTVDGFTGEQTTIFQNADGTYSFETINADGQLIDSGPLTGPVQTTVEITGPAGEFEGFATQVTNPDGSYFVIDNAGEIIDQGQFEIVNQIDIQEQLGTIYDNSLTVIEEGYKELKNLPVGETLEKVAKENFDNITAPVRQNLENLEAFSATLASDTASYADKFRAAGAIAAETASLYGNAVALAAVGPADFVVSTAQGTASSLANTYQNNVSKNEAIQNAKAGMGEAFDKTIEGSKQQLSSTGKETREYLEKAYDEISFQDRTRIVNNSAEVVIEAREQGYTVEVSAQKGLDYQASEINRRTTELHADFPTTSSEMDRDYA